MPSELSLINYFLQSTPKTGEKRKRGRPRKFPEGTFPKPNPDGPKRGRGRPRKILTAAETAAAAKKAEAAKNTPSKGRGRPRKEPGALPLVKESSEAVAHL